jgi:hypothetical protein
MTTNTMTPEDQHLADFHGPILTRGDLTAAEAAHAAQCTSTPPVDAEALTGKVEAALGTSSDADLHHLDDVELQLVLRLAVALRSPWTEEIEDEITERGGDQ